MTTRPPGEKNSSHPAAGTATPANESAAPWAIRLILPAIFTVVLIVILRPVLRMDGLESLWKIAKVLLGLGFVIFIHELGHFLVAKWCDVHVQVFSIGFGPALPGCSFQWGETVYKIALFPLGGYVKMVGEGAEDDESADDPRSFKKKSVGQRMGIISAGVVMNVLLAGACFSLVYELHGVKRAPAEVASVEAGSPAWEKGIPTGALIVKINNKEHPYFDDLQPIVMHSRAGEKITVVYEPRPPASGEHQPPDQTLKTIEIEPRRRKGDDQPLIGVSPPYELELVKDQKARRGLPPVLKQSAAANAAANFAFGDRIVGSTDPDHPATITPLPANPFAPDRKDYYEFYKRLVRLEGKAMVIQVRRAEASEGRQPPDEPNVALTNIEVPPSFHYTFGMRMRMGQITAVREGSSAARQGVVRRDPQRSVDGDIIERVEVIEPDGGKTRFITAHGGKAVNDKAQERVIDPMRLPFELEQWAERYSRAPGGPKVPGKVTLTVFRGLEHNEVPVELEWDDGWKVNREMQNTPSSPLSIPELGIAYRVECRIDALDPNGPAARAGLRENDVIEAIRFQEWDADKREAVPSPQWYDLDLDQWAWSFAALQRDDFKQVTFRVKRDNQPVEIVVEATEDSSWPLAERGLILTPDFRLQKAHGLGSAIAMGFERTYSIIIQTLQQVRAMITRRVSATKGLQGPISIGVFAYHFAGEGFFEFLNFLGIISVSLAVINFLPIPLLDGGHMAFLVYEGVRGKPVPEQVQIVLMYLGLLLILSLMFFAFYVDWRNWRILEFLFGK